MITIYKYPLLLTLQQTLHIPGLLEVLSVNEQRNNLVLYCAVDTENLVKVVVDVRILGTGQDASAVGSFNFLGTVNNCDGKFMWHVFVSILGTVAGMGN